MYNKMKDEIVHFLIILVVVSMFWLSLSYQMFIITGMLYRGELELTTAPKIINWLIRIPGLVICPSSGLMAIYCLYHSAKHEFYILRASLKQIKETTSKMKKNKSFSEMNFKEKCACMYGLSILTDTQLNAMSIEDKNNYNERIELAAETQCVHIAFIVVLIIGVFKYFIL